MAPRRTARGQTIDMEALSARYRDTLAVTGSRTRMNARGDILGRDGKPVITAEELVERTALIGRALADRKKSTEIPPAHLRKLASRAAVVDPSEVQKMARKLEEEEKAAAARLAETAAPMPSPPPPEAPVVRAVIREASQNTEARAEDDTGNTEETEAAEDGDDEGEEETETTPSTRRSRRRRR